MLVGAARIVLDFYNNDKVAVKKQNLEELCKGIRKKFNVSALEIADLDDPERCVIGVAAVIPEHWKDSAAQGLIQKICQEIDETAFARVTVEDWELLAGPGTST